MALGWKLVVDAADPYAQAVFWGAALEYEVEDNSALIGQLLESGAIDASETAEHEGRRFFAEAVAVRHPDDPVQEFTGIGLGRRLLFQRVPEAGPGTKTAKNRLHVDVHAGPGARAATVERLVSLGARHLRDVDEPQGAWSVLLDPEGNEFCVA
ncbi:VOC family protein [Streptomyces sp. HNM0574]|uniref:VOC family protein n=1 Tax=Streptomyces sp. HNM0574 TaxID=2714954 RepID=UPI00146F579B|nr:VOC family protein [Streptomyces sp. HNM0574]NLU70335.1 hypothetical protein [Streptomyces sp. HNM0574]